MKNILLFCALVFGIAGAAYAQVPAMQKVTGVPQFKFEEEVHDFGTVLEGPLAEYTFIFKNVGGAPLIIVDVHSTDGPTIAEWPKEPVMPGKKGKIKVTYRTQDHVAPFERTLFITSNVPAQSGKPDLYELRVKGIIVASDSKLPAGNSMMRTGIGSSQQIKSPRFLFEEEVHDFGNLEAGPPAKWKFWFKNVGNAPLLISWVSTGDGGSFAYSQKEPILPGKRGFVEFMQDTGGGRTQFERTIYVQSNVPPKDSLEDRYRLTAKGKIKPLK